MTSPARRLFLPSLLLLLLLHFVSDVAGSPQPNITDAHQELTSRGFPVGLLPDTVSEYTLEPNGKFKVFLDGHCFFTIPNESYRASYAPSITGVLKNGSIKGLDGISVRAFYKWWSITGIHVSNSNLVFEVGLINVNYPAANFDESPACDGQEEKISHSKS